MRTYIVALTSMLAGVVIGAVAVPSLRAQPTPPVYYVAEVDVIDPDSYAREYQPQARELIRQHGGRAVASGIPTMVAGDPPKSRVGIYAWDSMDQLQKWFTSPAFQDLRRTGQRYARFRQYALTGAAP